MSDSGQEQVQVRLDVPDRKQPAPDLDEAEGIVENASRRGLMAGWAVEGR